MPDEPTTTTSTPPVETPAQNPWGADFDAEKAWNLVQNLRGDKDKLQSRVAGFEKTEQERADAEKSELEKLTEQLQHAQATIAERDKTAARTKLVETVREKHGLSKDDDVFLTGDTEEELEARASALAARLGAKQETTTEVPGKPKAKLTPGHIAPEDAGNTVDPNAIADRIYKSIR